MAFVPQQYAVLSATAKAHTCCEPAVIARKAVPPTTAVGTLSSALCPSPSSTASFAPQQYAAPDTASPQVKKLMGLAVTCAQEILCPTRTGVPVKPDGAALASPSSPRLSSPQQYISCAVVTPHVCRYPTATSWNT